MYTIGRLARRAKVNADSIRFYERQGLLAAETKTGSGYRLYTDDALRRIAFIKHAQRCGFSLAEIGRLLQMHTGSAEERRDAFEIAARKQKEIDAALGSLQAMSAAIDSVLTSYDAQRTGEAHLEHCESPLVTALEARLSGGIPSARPMADAHRVAA
jgi:MerR family Zn(II)-responsive transcriptional regulator of zntA